MPDPDRQLNLFDIPPQKRRKATPRPIKGGSGEPTCDGCGQTPIYYNNDLGVFCLDCRVHALGHLA